jgi:molecular chaperone HscB
MNYFEFYGLPVQFVLDTQQVRQIYLANSRKYHPDFHTLKPEPEQQQALEQSILNTNAFKTLSDEHLRMKYILTLKGILHNDTSPPPLPNDFLMQVMDINESIETLPQNPALKKTILAEIQQLEHAIYQDIEPILTHYNDLTTTTDQLQAVKNFYLKKRYLLRMQENILKFAPH